MSKAPHESADPLERENWRRAEKKSLELDAAISALDTAIGDALPVGAVIPWPNLSVPVGWMLCDGSAVNRTTYADLFAAVCHSFGAATITIASPGVVTSTAHGLLAGDKVFFTTTGALPTGLTADTVYYVISAGLAADSFRISATLGGAAINTSGTQSGVHTLRRGAYGIAASTTFNIPDLRGRTIVGADGAAARLTATDLLGDGGGTETHTLTTAEMPSHSHSSGFSIIATVDAGATVNLAGAGGDGTGSTGGGGAHNNMQPFQVLSWIIKALPSGDDSLVIVAGDGLTASGGAMAVNVDNTTIGITADAVYVKDAGITNAKVATGIDALKLSSGVISNTEFDYLNGVTSAIQTQIDGKQASDGNLTAIVALVPADDDVIQRKAGAWANRTMAQLLADLVQVTGAVNLATGSEWYFDYLYAETAEIVAVGDASLTTNLIGAVNGDLEAVIAVIDAGTGLSTSIGGGKISSDANEALELKAGVGSTTNQGYIYLNGGQAVKMVYKSANYTVDIGDHEIIYTTLSAARTDTLPLLSTVPDGWWCVFGDGTAAGAAGTYNLIINEHATDGGTEVARLATNNHFVKVKKINGKWWRGPYELWVRTA